MIIIAIPNILHRKGLESLIHQVDPQVKIFTAGTKKELDQLLNDHQTTLIYVHSSFVQSLRIINLNENSIRVVRLIDTMPEILTNDNALFNIMFLDDTEQHIIKNIKRNIALSDVHEKPQQGEGELSDREKDIVREIALGRTNKEIADNLFISAHTVITHRKNITRKLGIKTVSGLTVYAILNKLIQMEEM